MTVLLPDPPSFRDSGFVSLSFQFYLITLPFTATAVLNPGGFSIPLSYVSFGLFALAFIHGRRPLVGADVRPVLALGFFVTILVGSSVLSILTQRVSEPIRDAAFTKLLTQTAYWLAACGQFWLSHAYLS